MKELGEGYTELDQRYYDYLKTDKWKRIAHKRLEIDNFECQFCGSRGSSLNPLQIHHLTYYHIFHEDEKDYIYTELCCVCRCCHGGIHSLMNRVTSESGRRGWKDICAIPKINTFVLSGDDLQRREVPESAE
jgi:5-methylcytosine-specific restriction endonuclease McrA